MTWAAVLWIWCAAASDAPADDGATLRAIRRPFRLVQRELGQIEAGKSTLVYAETEGEIVWIAPEGSRVDKGDPVVKLSNNVTEEQAEQDARRLEDAQLLLRRAQLDYELDVKEWRFGLKQKELAVRQAEWELRDLQQRATQRQLKMMELDARIARYQMDHAKLELDAARALQGTALEKPEELREKLAAYEKAVVEYQRAAALLNAARKGPNPRRLEVARKRLEQAKRSYELAKLRVKQNEKVGLANIEIQRASLYRAQERAKRSAREAELLTVRAPMAGTVTLTDVWKGEGEEPSPIRVGETRSRNMDLLKIADLSELFVRVHVSEADIRKIRPGQKARIRLVAFPDKTFRGEVARIAPFAEDKNIKLGYLALVRRGIAGVAVVDVLVRIVDKDQQLRLGLTAEVDITVIERPAAILLPHPAVGFENGRPFCYVRSGGRAVKRALTLGPANENEVVVESGLKEGEVVYRDYRAASAADRSKRGNPSG